MHQSIVLLIFCHLTFKVFGDNNSNSNCNCVPYYECSMFRRVRKRNHRMNNEKLLCRAFKKETCSGYFDVCCNIFKDFLELPTEKRNRRRGCGFQGSESFPWTTSLYYQTSAELTPVQKCGASLIHFQVVVTAAHCLIFLKPNVWTVRLGKYLLKIKFTKLLHHTFCR